MPRYRLHITRGRDNAVRSRDFNADLADLHGAVIIWSNNPKSVRSKIDLAERKNLLPKEWIGKMLIILRIGEDIGFIEELTDMETAHVEVLGSDSGAVVEYMGGRNGSDS